jgi:hypothetical protein
MTEAQRALLEKLLGDAEGRSRIAVSLTLSMNRRMDCWRLERHLPPNLQESDVAEFGGHVLPEMHRFRHTFDPAQYELVDKLKARLWHSIHQLQANEVRQRRDDVGLVPLPLTITAIENEKEATSTFETSIRYAQML